MYKATSENAGRALPAHGRFIERAAAGLLALLVAVFSLGVSLAPSAAAQSGSAPTTSSIIVKLVAGLSVEEQAAVVERNGGTEKSRVPALRLHVVELRTDQLDETLSRYRADPQVVRAEINKARKSEAVPSDPLYSQQWSLPKINWDLVFGNASASASVVVAILDTGIDATHPDLAGNVVPGTSILDGSNGMSDPSGHGTRVAGIVAARTNTTTPEGIAGVAYAGVQLMPVAVLNAQGLGQDSDVIAGVIWAADHGADVILMAFSNPDYSESLQEAIDYAWSKDAILVAAVGNEGGNAPSFPAGDRGVIGVAATNSDDQLASFSNSGAAVFLAAPGTDILTTDPYSMPDPYSSMTGTSSSAAIVAGAAAQLWAFNPTLSNGIIVGRLARSADPAGTREQTGNGRVNIARALADTGTDFVQPAGAAPVGPGGPFVGPYRAAAEGVLATWSLATQTISVSLTGLSNGKHYQVSYEPPSGAKTFRSCFDQSVTTASDSLTLSGNYTTGMWTVRLDAYNNNNNACANNGSGQGSNNATTTDTVNVTAKTNQTITVTTAAPASATYNTSFNVAATASSALTVAITTTGGCSGSGSGSATVTMTSGTTACVVHYNQAGNGSFNAAPEMLNTTSATKANQTITFGALGGKTFGDAPFTVSANASSNLPVSFASQTGGTCSVAGSTVTILAAGGCTIRASQAGDGNYNAAPNVDRPYTIAPAASATTVTCPASVPYTGTAQTPCTVSVTGAGGLSLTPTPTYSNNTNAGTATAGYTFAGDGNHTGSSDSKTFTIAQASSTTTVSCPASVTFTGSALTPCTVSVTGAGGLSLTPSATYSNNTNTGTATASYTFAGDANHTGSSDSKTFTIAQAASTTTVTCPANVPFTGSAQTPCTVSVTGAGGLSLTPAATYSNNTNAGTATASYTFAGDANHTGSSDSKNFTIAQAASTTTVTCPASVPFTGSAQTPCTVSVTGAGGLSLTPAATYSNNTNAGTAMASYTFAGDANHTGSSDSKNFTIAQAASTTTVTCPASVPFTGLAQTPCTVSVTGAGGLSLTPSATYSNNTNAGTATASYTFAGDANHTSSSDSKTFTIAQAPSTTTVTCPASVPFTGAALEPCTANVTGAGGLNQSLTVSYSNNTGPGTATASALFAGDANHTGSSDSKNFTIVDDTPPDTSIDAPYPPSPTNLTGATFYFSGTDNVTAPANLTFECQFDGAAYGLCTSPTTYPSGTFVVNGSHTFYVRAKDEAGNVDSAPAQFTWMVDTSPPNTQIDSNPFNPSLTASANFTFSSNDSNATFECQVDSGGFTACASPTSYTLLDGQHTFEVRAKDQAGNYDPTPASFTWTIDTTAPNTTLLSSSPQDPTNSTTATFTFESDDPNATFECSLDPTFPTFTACGSPQTYSGLGEGEYTFKVRAKDAAGNVDTSFEQFVWMIDLTPPNTQIDSGPALTTTDTNATFTFSGTDNLSNPGDLTFECSLDGGAFVGCTNSYTITVSRGGHTMDVRATDKAGNTDQTPAAYSWTVTKYSSTTVVTCTASVPFTGSAQEPCTATVTGVGGLNQSLTVTYSNNTNAGTATASASFGGDADHDPSSDSKTFTIAQAASTTTVTCPASVPFTSSAQEPCTVSVTGVGGLSLTPTPTYSNNTNAGTATASYTFAGDANHTGSSDSKNFTIAQAASTTAVTCPASVPFTGSAQEPCTVSVTGAGGLSLTPSATYSNNTNAGTATASYTFAGDANHTGSSDSKNFTIAQAASTTAVTCPASVPFTGSALTPCTVSVTGAGGLSLTPAATYSNNTNAGTATASYTFAGDANHTGSSDSKNFTIAQAASTTAVTCPANVPFTGSAQTPCTVSVTGAGGLSLTPAATYSNNTNAGTATASYTFAGDANHTGSSDSKNFTIAQAASTTTVTCPASVPFTGSAQTPCTVSVTGAGGLSLTPAATYSNNTNAGTAMASYTFAGDANHTGSSDSKNFTIAQAASTTTVTCPASVPFTGLAQTPCTVSVTGAGGLSLTPSATYSNNTNAGTATASYTFAGDANHTGSSDSKNFAIAQAASTTTVTCPASVPFTGSAQTPCPVSVTGSGGLNLTSLATYSNNTNAGTATASYTFTGDANHTGSSDSKNFTIAQAASTTTVTCPASVTFNGSAQTPCTANVTGAGGLNQSLTVTYANNTNAGTATASASFVGDANHTGSSDSKTFTINKADPTVTLAPGPVVNYQFTAVATTNALTAATISVDADSTSACAISGTVVTILTGTGTCRLTANWPANANYNAATAQSSTDVSVNSACTISDVNIANTSWNSFKVPTGTSPFVWVHAHIGKPKGVPTNTVSTMLFTGITLTLNGTLYALNDGVLTFDPAAPPTISTTYNSILKRWETLINPNNLSDEIFFTGAAVPVSAANTSSAKATVTYDVSSSAPHVSMPWQWSAAVYTVWPGYLAAQIQPYHDGNHAGTPLNPQVQQSLIQGPRGGAGSNFTGSWSGTGNASCL